jgi:peptidyl-prolyl cis-trans isomerase B (cyclophilin B)
MKKSMRFFAGMLSLVMVLLLTACTGSSSSNTTPAPSATPKPSPTPSASTGSADLERLTQNKVNITIEMQDGGKIKAELYPDLAPITVANFEKLINEHFFDGLIFHRVISGFMIQGGGYDSNMQPKESESIKGEFTANGIENPLEHTRGVLSMARTQVKDSASSQFFIMHQDSPHLDGQYAAFGKVTEGMDVVDKIASVQTDSGDRPTTPQIIKTITMG